MTRSNTTGPLGNALATMRMSAGLSSSSAAESLGIQESALRDIEGGTEQAPTTLLANMARLYHASPFLVVKAYLADRRA
jgi:hypothetical protein